MLVGNTPTPNALRTQNPTHYQYWKTLMAAREGRVRTPAGKAHCVAEK